MTANKDKIYPTCPPKQAHAIHRVTAAQWRWFWKHPVLNTHRPDAGELKRTMPADAEEANKRIALHHAGREHPSQLLAPAIPEDTDDPEITGDEDKEAVMSEASTESLIVDNTSRSHPLEPIVDMDDVQLDHPEDSDLIRQVKLKHKNADGQRDATDGTAASKHASYVVGTSMKTDEPEELMDSTDEEHSDPEPRARKMVHSLMCVNEWTSAKAAIICINNNFSLVNETISIDERITTASIIDNTTGSIITNVASIYMPTSVTTRHRKQRDILTHPAIMADSSNPWLICGDLNVHLYDASLPGTDRDFAADLWKQHHDLVRLTTERTSDHYSYTPSPTFKSTQCHRTTIDYVLGNDAGAELAQASGQFFLPRLWTDHHLVYVDLTLQRPTMEQLLAAFHSRRKRPDLSPQEQWEDMMTSVQILATNVMNTLYFFLTTSFPYFNKTLLYLSIASQHDKLLHFSTACYYRSSVDILI
ncbi:hypothetical protein DM01DRAFT_1375444 [Hesseltinella vesiculosa]|uniref:Endonuclease/exonuclease/phosphatase domain-containing protein n=1 Tax=Hesseltinella vesiculosa TaxID=101127 RepID=A0A1X2GD38_9FUNG|nr:hypothetical protein DM01DRAFT_1375444 [Hesseltinella vesiculosa]